jgi:hypothetical protein
MYCGGVPRPPFPTRLREFQRQFASRVNGRKSLNTVGCSISHLTSFVADIRSADRNAVTVPHFVKEPVPQGRLSLLARSRRSAPLLVLSPLADLLTFSQLLFPCALRVER